MKLSSTQVIICQQKHDSYCKTILRNAARGCHREQARFNSNNGLIVIQMSDSNLDQFQTTDEYLDDNHCFDVDGHSVFIKDDRIIYALEILPEFKREIILRYYFLDMSDREIAHLLGRVTGTANHHRKTAINLLREILKGS